jgi:hypothetical protein
MYRDPITNRFTAGNPPEQTPEQAPEPIAERPTHEGGWDFVPQPGDPGVHAVTDVLGVASYDVKDSHTQQTDQPIGPEPVSTNDGPIGQGGHGAPRA